MPINDFELTDQIPPSEDGGPQVPSQAAATDALSIYLHYQ